MSDDDFFEACEKGQLETAKCLYSFGFDIDDENEAFRLACYNGRLTVAEWLLSLGHIDIHMSNDKIFKFACAQNNLHIISLIISSDYIFFYKCIMANRSKRQINNHKDKMLEKLKLCRVLLNDIMWNRRKHAIILINLF